MQISNLVGIQMRKITEGLGSRLKKSKKYELLKSDNQSYRPSCKPSQELVGLRK